MIDEHVDRKKISINILVSCLLFFLITGCRSAKEDVSTLTFDKDGHILEYLVEDFPADSYDVSEWEDEVRKGMDAYNKSGKGTITLSDVEFKEDKLKCMVDYDSDDAYFYLNNEPLFYGTVSQAVKAGYSMTVPVFDTKSGDELPPVRLKDMSESNIIIIGRPIQIKTHKKIRYASGSVHVEHNLKSAVIEGEDTAYIVFD